MMTDICNKLVMQGNKKITLCLPFICSENRRKTPRSLVQNMADGGFSGILALIYIS